MENTTSLQNVYATKVITEAEVMMKEHTVISAGLPWTCMDLRLITPDYLMSAYAIWFM